MATKIIKAPEILDLFAANGDKAVIPLNKITQGTASLDEGFPKETGVRGGNPVRRTDFNGILSQFSEFHFYNQSGGGFEWSADRDYIAGCEVFGSNGVRYRCMLDNGVNYSGAKDPVDPANSYKIGESNGKPWLYLNMEVATVTDAVAGIDKNLIITPYSLSLVLDRLNYSLWKEQTLPAVADWSGIACTPSGVLCAVARYSPGATTSNLAATSHDGGFTWQQRTLSASIVWRSITSTPSGILCTVGSVNSAFGTDVASISNDGGVTWKTSTLPRTADWRSITSTPSGVLCAVPYSYVNNPTDAVAISNDGGVTWQEKTLPRKGYWYRVASTSSGILCALGSNYAAISNDGGVTWQERTLPKSAVWNIASTPSGALCAVPSNGGDFCLISKDGGFIWQTITLPIYGAFQNIACTPSGVLCALSNANKSDIFLSSDDGTTWETKTSQIKKVWRALTSTPDGVLCAVPSDSNIAITNIKII